jgi:hypothetical protein
MGLGGTVWDKSPFSAGIFVGLAFWPMRRGFGVNGVKIGFSGGLRPYSVSVAIGGQIGHKMLLGLV